MSSLDLDDEDADPDSGWVLGTELRTRFAAAQEAISRAAGVKDELAAVGSHFAAYVKSTEKRAIKAMIELCRVDPQDAYEILRLQKEIAGFADVHQWLSNIMLEADDARAEHEEASAAAEQRQSEQEE